MLPSVSLKHASRNSNFPVLVRFTTRISGSVDFLPINVSINDVLRWHFCGSRHFDRLTQEKETNRSKSPHVQSSCGHHVSVPNHIHDNPNCHCCDSRLPTRIDRPRFGLRVVCGSSA